MFAVEKQGAVSVVRPRGPIEAKHCKELRDAALHSFSAGRPMLVIDFHDVPLVDGAGLETLLDLRETLEARGGAVKLAGVNALCADIFRATGVGRQFQQYPLVRYAVGSFAE